MDKEYLQILDNNENEVMRIYSYNFSSELLGKENITVELDLPIQYKNNEEIPYPFETTWHIAYNNDFYYLNNINPTGVKNNEKRTIHYTLVFESKKNQLDNVYLKSFGRVFTDNDNDGYADDDEIISDVIFQGDSGFYGNFYDFAAFLRKNLEYVYGYITNNNGDIVQFNYVDSNNINHTSVCPKYSVFLNKIDYSSVPIPENSLLVQVELADTQSLTPKYNVSDKENIDTSNVTFLGALKKMNEVFTYKETINGKKQDIGYTFDTKILSVTDINNNTHNVFCIILDGNRENVKDKNNNDVVFEYGGLKKNGGLLSITRTTNENKTPTRIYGIGSSENLPINYFHIFEDRTNEIFELGGNKIPNLAYLESYFANGKHSDELDLSKYYLVPNKDFPFVWDRYFYASVEPEFAGVDFIQDGTFSIISSSVIECNSFNYIAKTYIALGDDSQAVKQMLKGYIYTCAADACFYDATGEFHHTSIWNGVSDSFQNGVPIVSNEFLETGTIQLSKDSALIYLVNADNYTLSDDERDEDKVYFIIRKTQDGTNSYHGSFEIGVYTNGFYKDIYTTYERCNPFPKYITSLTNLMPECFRAYITGWYYGYLWKQHYPLDDIRIDSAYNIIETNSSSFPYNQRMLIKVKKECGFPLAYMPTYDDETFVSWELLGLLDTKTNSEYYNLDLFNKGLKDFCFGIKVALISTAAGTISKYDYSDCGKIWKPIDYYEKKELIEKYGVIETKQTFDDIKPSLVGQYVNGQGRLDELVDVYIPCINQNDTDKWGKYWEDVDYIEIGDDGNKHNTLVPDLPIPEDIIEDKIEFYQKIDSSKLSAYISGSFSFSTVGIDFNTRKDKYMYLSIDSDIPTFIELVNLNDGTGYKNQVIPVPMKYHATHYVIGFIKDENNTTLEKYEKLVFFSGYITIGVQFTSSDGIIEKYSNLINRKKWNYWERNNYSILTKNEDIEGYVYATNENYIAANVDNSRSIFFFSNTSNTKLVDKGSYGDLKGDTVLKGANPLKNTGWKKYELREVINFYTGSVHYYLEKTSDTEYTLEYVRNIDNGDSNGASQTFAINIPNKEFEFSIKTVGGAANFTNLSKEYCNDWAKKCFEQNNCSAFCGVTDKSTINLKWAENFDFITQEFFIWIKDIKFNPTLSAWQGDSAPMFVFSSGDLAGIDNKFALSEAHSSSFIEDSSRSIQTDKDEDDNTQITVNSKYRATLRYILNDYADNKSIFPVLPQKNVKPSIKDLFIIENAIYPHNPYTYSAERKLYDKMKDLLDIESLYTYNIVFDDFVRTDKGINFTQLKVGNYLNILNKSLIISPDSSSDILKSYQFTIKSVSITRSEDSLYDKYTLVLENLKKVYNVKKNTLLATDNKLQDNVTTIITQKVTDNIITAINNSVNPTITTKKSSMQKTTKKTAYITPLRDSILRTRTDILTRTLNIQEIKNQTIKNKKRGVLNGQKNGQNFIFTSETSFVIGTSELYINGVRYFLNDDYTEANDNQININTYIPKDDDFIEFYAEFKEE